MSVAFYNISVYCRCTYCLADASYLDLHFISTIMRSHKRGCCDLIVHVRAVGVDSASALSCKIEGVEWSHELIQGYRQTVELSYRLKHSGFLSSLVELIVTPADVSPGPAPAPFPGVGYWCIISMSYCYYYLMHAVSIGCCVRLSTNPSLVCLQTWALATGFCVMALICSAASQPAAPGKLHISRPYGMLVSADACIYIDVELCQI